ncbi:MAG TPA: glycosyltransferase family 2 protein, partial [Bacteroidia bacterium]|nr:glycosyltransferase family 2 protein [Bacteroidia bacterium]
MIQKLSIIIPVFNESETIISVLEKVSDVQLINNIAKQIIIVDDHSSDNSLEAITQFKNKHPQADITIVKQQVNMGKGYAVRTGMSKATGDYIIIQDADLELNPDDFNILLKTSLDQNAQVVYGSRFLKKQQSQVPLLTLMANRILSMVTSLLTGKKVTDMETCYKLIDRSLLQNIQLKENR